MSMCCTLADQSSHLFPLIVPLPGTHGDLEVP
jgi:hypothetical protein